MYYFASDVHLGLPGPIGPVERDKLFVRWLDHAAKDARAIFLVGDIFDFWYEYVNVIPKGHTRLLGKLSELTDRGIEIHLFAGNHDMWSFGYLEKECGVHFHREPYITTELYGKRVLIGHGDVVGRRPAAGRFLGGFFRLRAARRAFHILHPDIAMWAGNRWSRSNRSSRPVRHEFRGEEERLVEFAREYLEKEHADLFVFGHIHCAEIFVLNETSRVAFLGEWIENPTYGVMDEAGFSLKEYK